jgi:5-methylcytosine-specific restriction endonuclease McrA
MSTGVKKRWNKKMRMYVAQQGRCWLCGDPMPKPLMRAPAGDTPPEYPTQDHVKPRSKGGTKGIANLMLAHRACNAARADHEHVRAIRRGEHQTELKHE